MFIQDQLPHERVNDENLAYYKAIGVDYLTIYPPPQFAEYSEKLDYLKAKRRQAERHGLPPTWKTFASMLQSRATPTTWRSTTRKATVPIRSGF